MTRPLLVKKNPIVIIRDLVLYQLLAILGYFFLGFLANYNELFQTFNLYDYISYDILKIMGIILFEAFLFLFAVFRWLLETYAVYPRLIIYERGVFFKKRDIYKFEPPIKTYHHAQYFGGMFRYGTVVIQDKDDKQTVAMGYIQSPKYTAKLIAHRLNIENKREEKKEIDLGKLLHEREREDLEFKSTFRWDMKLGKVNSALEYSVLKTVAAFLNTHGGQVLIGVTDQGEVLGLLQDYESLKKKNSDGFENYFTILFRETIGAEFRRFVKFYFLKAEDKELCLIEVGLSDQPAYLQYNGEEYFYIRTGNSTTALTVSEAGTYIKARF